MNSLTIENQDFLLSLPDLCALAQALALKSNELSLLPTDSGSAEQQAQVLAEFKRLDEDAKERLTLALATLRAPVKVADLHHTIADESITRVKLAWAAGSADTLVAVAGTTDPRRISAWSEPSMAASVRQILAAEAPLRDDEIACKVTTPSALVFLAAIDQLRAVRLYAMLTHAAPTALFSKAEVLERLSDAASEDFRWPLTFVEKLLPSGLTASYSAEEVDAALAELVAHAWIERVAPDRYEISDAGQIICDGILHDVSKLGIGVTAQRPDGQWGRDVVLLIRSAFHLFAIAMAGQEAVIAAVDNDELAALLHTTLQAPQAAPGATQQLKPESSPPMQPQPPKLWHFLVDGQTQGPVPEGELRERLARGDLPAQTQVWNPDLPQWCSASEGGLIAVPQSSPATPKPALTSLMCHGCHHPIQPDMKFCQECGLPVLPAATPATCPKCATPFDAGTRFCATCGTALN